MTAPGPVEGVPTGHGPVVVGVVPGQRPAVVLRAAELAASLRAQLVCAWVDTELVVPHRGGSRPVDPDGIDDDGAASAEKVSREIGAAVDDMPGPGWSLRILAGEPSRALAALADDVGAALIVVGTRERGLGHRLEELVSGSVAANLAHRQQRCVVVVPPDARPIHPPAGDRK